MRRRRFAALAGFGAVLATVLVPGLAGAQDDRRPSQVMAVDASNAEAVVLTVRSDAPPEQLQGAQLSISAGNASIVAEATQVPKADQRIVLLIEASNALDDANGLVVARQAAKAAIADNDGVPIAIYAYSERSRRMASFTADAETLNAAIDDIVVRPGGAAMWDAISGAAKVLGAEGAIGGTVILVAGTADEGSVGGQSAARGSLIAAGANISVVGLQTGTLPEAPLQGLARDTLGAYRAAGNQEQLNAALVDARLGASNLWSITFQMPEEATGLIQASLKIGNETVAFEFGAGRDNVGAVKLVPTPPSKRSSLGFLSGTVGKLLGVALVALAAAGMAYSLALIFGTDNELSDVLSVYTEGIGGGEDELDANRIKSAIVQRAVEFTEQVAEQQGMLTKVENMLEQASIPLRAAEAIFFYLLGAFVLAVVGFVIMGGPIGALVLAILGLMFPPAFVNFRAGRRRKTFVAQLPDMLQLLAGTLRAGFSLMQGVEAVSQEVDGPMGEELRRVVTESRLGRPLEEALDGAAQRMESQDFGWTVMAISIQREVGGNLAELLLTVADTMVQRERLRGEISALTAEGRISAIVLGIMPPGLGVTMYTINPTYMEKLFTTGLGNFLLGLSFVSAMIGFVWMKKIIDIDI